MLSNNRDANHLPSQGKRHFVTVEDKFNAKIQITNAQ